jgi:SHS2 domain-containing protein
MMQEEAGYTLFEHTADAGLVAWGPNPGSAFNEATRGMFSLMLGTDPSESDLDGEPEQISIQVGGEFWDDLLVNWLAEVLVYFDTEGLVPVRIDFKRCAPPACAADLHCVRVDDPEQLGGVGVKAITYHQLYVRVEEDRAELRVIFDI